MMLFMDNRRFLEYRFENESDFERDVCENHKLLFGKDVIWVDVKKRIGTETLGRVIPDGFLFDMSDPENRQFYLLEVELERHDFFNHIFPQITKFFGFFNNSNRQKELVEKLFAIVNSNGDLKKQFKKYLGEKEIFKFLTDVVDGSQNILIVIDGEKPEFAEIMGTYADTWGKMVKLITARKYVCGEESIMTLDPEFESIEFAYPELPGEKGSERTDVSEEHHLETVRENVKKVYYRLKEEVLKLDSNCVFNPTVSYISVRTRINIAFVYPRKRLLRVVVLVDEEDLRSRINHHTVVSITEQMQREYYSHRCAAINLYDTDHLDEVVDAIGMAMKENE